MDIVFSDKYAVNPQTFGINFEAIVDGQSVVCSVTIEALQDVEPDNAFDTAEQQFIANRSRFEAIAEEKIRTRAVFPVSINSSDLRD